MEISSNKEKPDALSAAAFNELYTQYYPLLFKFVNGMLNASADSEEIVHDIFLKIWEERSLITQAECQRAYLFKMAKNKLINRHEHRLVKQKAYKYIGTFEDNVSKAADEDYIYKQYEHVLSHAIANLPRKRKVVFEMRSMQERSFEEIARELSISKSMVKKQYYAAKKQIRNYLFQHTELTFFLYLAIFFS